MAELKDKLVEAVAKLIKLTQENEIKWTVLQTPEILKGNPDDFVENVFVTTFNQRKLRLYERVYSVDIIPIVSVFANEKTSWRSETSLEIVDSDYNSIWAFPKVTPLSDLLVSVRYQVAGVDDFIEDLLNQK